MILRKRLGDYTATNQRLYSDSKTRIESRVRYFRTRYGAIEVMLSKSGFTWDAEKKMVQCEKQQYDIHSKIHSEAKGLYGVPFPYYERLAAIYNKDIATGEGAEGFGEAIANLQQEIIVVDEDHEVDQVLREAEKKSMAGHSFGSTSSCKKKRREKAENEVKSDPLLTMMAEVHGGLMKVSEHVGTMASAAIRDVEMQEKATHEDPQKKLNEEAMDELKKLGFVGSEIVRCARVFVKTPGEIQMMMAVPANLRREYVLEMLKG